jgi:Flp pilus assembly pilin Flp
MFAHLNNLVRKFHNDEEGLESLQVVMIIAIAAMIMIVASTVGQEGVDWMTQKWNDLKGQEIQ